MKSPLLRIRNLKKSFYLERGFLSQKRSTIHAVNSINLEIFPEETLGLVGESGCGKSTLGRMIMMLEKPTAGDVIFNGKSVLRYSSSELKLYRKSVQIIFQDPYASLNPRRTVGDTLSEPLTIYKIPREKKEKIIAELMELVGLSTDHKDRYPHEFSGGQRQRIGIARAIALNPKLIIADEPVSALDVSIQAQILNLMKDLQKSYGLAYLFISHDLGVVHHMCDRIAVMYLGKIVELAMKKDLYESPLHPYTKALLSAVPSHEPGRKKGLIILTGDLSSFTNLTTGGCSFHPRCPFKMEICRTNEPCLEDRGNGHWVSCHIHDR